VSSAPAIVSIDSAGRATALAPGHAVVTAIAHATGRNGAAAEGVEVHMPFVVEPEDATLAGLHLTAVSSAAASDAHFVCAIDQAGRARCWGSWLGRGGLG
jgi:hypothetical protein